MIVRKKILVVEDNPINRAVLTEILSSDYQVLEVENGRDALSVLKEHKEEISLILLDIIMPVMDGYTFLSTLKADPSISSIPVIVTTQSDNESDEVAALSHGATDFVVKPYKPQVILHRVASIINLRETAAMVNLMQFDRLTGLYSKEFFYQRVKEIVLSHPDKHYDIVCSDIENFKLINDIFGIPSGNRLLCGVAELYKKKVGERGICGRFNADQFACLVEHQAVYCDDMFLEASAKINALTNIKNVVMKWGIYHIEDHTITVEQMCDRALLAARSIKGQYGKHFMAYNDQLRGKLLREQEITNEMESALAEGQFEVYLQPKYRMQDGCLAGAEALVRWNHPTRGLQPPSEFIPLFEKNGFITNLDQFVWERVCATLQEWDQKNYPAISVSVNVSRADIYNADLVDFLLKIIKKYGLSASRLHLEITESAYTENPSQIIDTVCQLRGLGFVVEMDDFGSGYSSLNMLNQMPLDILKLDMKFIQTETAKPAKQGILHFIMGIARSMRLRVVAEGVETGEQLERLYEIGCDYVQGYYFAKPMPCMEFEAMLQSQDPADANGKSPFFYGEGNILLIADEDAAYRKALRTAFEAQYRILEADNYPGMLSLLKDYGSKIAAVIFSMTMCSGTGISLLEALRYEKEMRNIPMIATGPPDEKLEALALDSGANDYADKPHLTESLAKRLKNVMALAGIIEREQDFPDGPSRDFLTGFLNRKGLESAAASLQWEGGARAVYLFELCDLDKIQETCGHRESDRLVRLFSALLCFYIKNTDILARLEKGKFVLIQKAPEDVAQKGKDICNDVQKISLAGNLPAACHCGIVIWEEPDSLETAIQRSEEALRCAKGEGKGAYCLWKNEIRR